MSPHAALPRRVSLGIAPRFEADGVWVDAIQPGSSAETAGLAARDRLLRVAEIAVSDADSHARALRAGATFDSVEVVVARGDQTLGLALAHRTAPVEAGPSELVTIEAGCGEGPLRIRGHLVRAPCAEWLVLIVGGLTDTPCELIEGSYGACFEQFVDTLRRNQVSTLRFDRRGIGDSEGAATRACHTDDIEDTVAALQFARAHHQGPIACFGHSTGAITAALARESIGSEGHSVPLAIFGAPADPWFACLREGTMRHHVREGLTAAEAEQMADQEVSHTAAWARAGGSGTFEGRSARWHAELARHDPVALIGVPGRRTLVLDGGLDLAVPRSAALRFASASNTEARVFPELDHWMQRRPPTKDCEVAVELVHWLAIPSP